MSPTQLTFDPAREEMPKFCTELVSEPSKLKTTLAVDIPKRRGILAHLPQHNETGWVSLVHEEV